MASVSRIKLNGEKKYKQEIREQLFNEDYLRSRFEEVREMLDLIRIYPLRLIDRKIKHGENLTFEEAFCGMLYVLAATNQCFYGFCKDRFDDACGPDFSVEKALVCGSAFVQMMAVKESLSGLTEEEIAGIAAASALDPVIRLDFSEVVETCGMGGDIGFRINGETKKTINISTLSALVLSALGLPAIKHGSYSNTSAIGSTEAIELLGARINYESAEEVMAVWKKCGFCFLDAHWCKTIHDLSHLLMLETINHIAGPMSLPVKRSTKINKLMGVNEKVHPSKIALAYTILHKQRMQNVGGVAVVCGLDENGYDVDPLNLSEVKKHVILDEISPYASVVAFAYGDRYLGCYKLLPSDFGVEIDPQAIQIKNIKDAIYLANWQVLRGENEALGNYLAMNAALGLFAMEYLSRVDSINENGPNRQYLQECFERCKQAIFSRKVWEVIVLYINVTNKR